MSFTYRKKTETITCKGRCISLLILSPTDKNENSSGVLWIHGGGYVTGMKEMALFSRAMYFVKRGCTVVSPDYTLAGKAPYPAALEDCYAALMWMRKNAPDLGFSSDRIIVGGESAGGGLCAALCMYARDRKEVNVCYQFPLYPMLDCNDTPSSRDNHGKIWNTKRNRNAWKKYLSGLTEVTPYASPSRQTDYSSLPPMYSFVGTGEPFFCETIQYMKDLRRALGKSCLLTLASNCSPRYIDFRSVVPYVDFVNLMTYDMDENGTFHCALYPSANTGHWTADKSVREHIKAGVPAEKIVLGVPFYGKGSRQYRGGRSFKDTYPIPEGCTEKWDNQAKAPYVVDAEGKFVFGFENERSLKIKCDYIKENGLHGIMNWEYAGDDENLTLTRTMHSIAE